MSKRARPGILRWRARKDHDRAAGPSSAAVELDERDLFHPSELPVDEFDNLELPNNEAAAIAIPAPDSPESPPTPSVMPPPSGTSDAPRLGDMRTTYHPNSRRPTAEHASRHPSGARAESTHTIPFSDEPWKPFFNSHEDFLFSEILLESGMNKERANRLIKLFRKCINGDGTFTLSNYSDVQAAWERASEKLTPFECDTVSAEYKGEERSFEVYYRPLWDWARDLLTNPLVAPHFEWDAQKIFRHNGESFIRIIDEPWTGDAFWDAQTKLPEGASPFCLILYADKTKLSSFGTKKGYPVVVRCANLPAKIRNGEGIGGGCIVGWLPIVPEEASETKNVKFVNFKRIIWHKSFFKISNGHPDPRWIFPLILILSADFEEQCFMALTRGHRGKLPCPICLVPNTELTNFSTKWPPRTAEDTKRAVYISRDMNRADAERLLSKLGMRDVDNAFWLVENSDPYRALSFDRLHNNNSGLFGHHLWKEFTQRVLKGYGRAAEAKVDAQFDKAPRWSGLTHFENAIATHFADGKSHEDISKEYYHLRKAEVGGDESEVEDSDGDSEVEGTNDKTSSKVLKSWRFPKFHALEHSFDDILAKGVSRNYNTKPNEKMHGPLKKAYLLRTNFKDVESQILRYDHFALVTTLIRESIDASERQRREAASDADDDDLATESSAEGGPNVTSGSTLNAPASSSDGPQQAIPRRPRKIFEAVNVTLRSQRSSMTLETLESNNSANARFRNFRIKLSRWLNESIPIYGLDVPRGMLPVELKPGHKITEYQSLSATFQSKVDLKHYIDLIYCNPSFHGAERHDFVIVQTEASFFFAQLLFIFTCSIADTTLGICLIRPCEPVAPRPKDLALRLCHVRAKASVEFVFARSIIRGAPLIENFDRVDDYFVMDVAEHAGDLFLRCKELFKHLITRRIYLYIDTTRAQSTMRRLARRAVLVAYARTLFASSLSTAQARLPSYWKPGAKRVSFAPVHAVQRHLSSSVSASASIASSSPSPSGPQSSQKPRSKTWRPDHAMLRTDQSLSSPMPLPSLSQCFFAIRSEGKVHNCALIHWYSRVGSRPDETTGMWIVRPDKRQTGEPAAAVISLDSIFRAVHLIPDYGTGLVPQHFTYEHTPYIFERYYVNDLIDHHAFRNISNCSTY
ncbi:hypothetical protein BC834DRAFT_1020051 [Gloeopeniophorella convolvens]|nr:hypothetical protein BC834DRAFT_1020051 [Gloeopeniophorella convolvens]